MIDSDPEKLLLGSLKIAQSKFLCFTATPIIPQSNNHTHLDDPPADDGGGEAVQEREGDGGAAVLPMKNEAVRTELLGHHFSTTLQYNSSSRKFSIHCTKYYPVNP